MTTRPHNLVNQHTFKPHPLEQAKAKSTHVYTTHLNGCFYGDAHHMARDLKHGQEVFLVALDDNKHDQFAIGVFVNDGAGAKAIGDTRVSLLGYVPQREDPNIKIALWKLLANGVKMHGVLHGWSVRDACISSAVIEIRVGEQ